MRILLITVMFLSQSSWAKCPTKDMKCETDVQYVERSTKSKIYNNQIGRNKLLLPGSNTLTAFTEQPDGDTGDFEILLNIFVPQKDGQYDWDKIRACEMEGGSPILRSFFYVNADRDPDLEIGVICGWERSNAFQDCPNFDEVRFFKLSKGKELGKLSRIDDTKFSKFYEKKKLKKNDDLECTRGLFTNADDIKRILQTLGY